MVPGSRADPTGPEARLLRLVATPTTATRTRGSSSSTPRRPTGPGTRSPASTSGTGSSATSRTSTTTTPRSRRRCSTSCGSGSTWASTASGSTRCPTCSSARGTNCENLPETHEFLQARPRATIDAQLPRPGPARRGQPVAGRRASTTSASGDECHMAFHFPVMPRIFMALRREELDARSSTILEQTPDDPGQLPVGHLPAQPRRADPRDGHRRGARLHVGRVRQDPRMKLNIGIRRRLAPLLDNGRDEIELFTALLLSLPGSPVALLRRRDRHGRQHLARRPRRRAHPDAVDPATATPASRRADPAQLYLPPLIGPGLRLPGGQRRGAAADTDLAAALDPPDHRASARSTRCFGLGTFEPTSAGQPARARRTSAARGRASTLLCVTTSRASRSRSSSTCRRSTGWSPIELFGATAFPRDRRAALPAHPRRLRLLLVPDSRGDRSGVTTEILGLPESQLLEFVRRQRWFGGKGAGGRCPASQLHRPRRSCPRRAASSRTRSSRIRLRTGHRDATRSLLRATARTLATRSPIREASARSCLRRGCTTARPVPRLRATARGHSRRRALERMRRRRPRPTRVRAARASRATRRWSSATASS